MFQESGNIWNELSKEVGSITHHLVDPYFVETSIAAQLGWLALLFGGIALLVQLFLASKILERFGVMYSMLVFFGGMLGVAATFLVGGVNMKFVRGYQHGFEALFACAYHISFYSVFSHRRESIRHFFEGFVRPAGMIAGIGGFVMLQMILPQAGGWLMLGLSVFLFALIFPMRHFYTEISRNNLNSQQDIAAKLHSIEILSQPGHKKSTDILGTELLKSDLHPIIREKIVAVTGQKNDPKIVHYYLKILAEESETETIKIQVLESLLKLNSLQPYWNDHVFAQHHLLQTLKSILEQTQHRHLRKLIIMSVFRHLPIDQVVPFFLDMLASDDPEIKSVCLRSAGEIFNDPEVSYYIRSYLTDKNTRIQGYAIIAMWNFEDKKFLGKMLESLLDSSTEKSIITALYVIGEVQDKSREEALLGFANHTSKNIKLHALVALAKLGNVQCVFPLIKILFGGDEAFSQKTFFMLKRAPAILPILKREIQFEVSRRVMDTLIQENVSEHQQLKGLSNTAKSYLKRLYRLAEKYDEILVLET